MFKCGVNTEGTKKHLISPCGITPRCSLYALRTAAFGFRQNGFICYEPEPVSGLMILNKAGNFSQSPFPHTVEYNLPL